jgi:murein L,D-transpeptidase YafK
MKLFTAVLLFTGVLSTACSTNSTTTLATPETTIATPVVYKPTVAATAKVDNTGIRPMQKFYRASGTASGPVRIIVDKSDFELRVYDSKGLLAAYPVVFGSKPLEDKFMQGDRKTPEGTFKIVYSKEHQRWRKMLMLDYPTTESLIKYNLRKKDGLIPATAAIGNGIGIHGVETGKDYFIDRYVNWTNGCISLKNTHIDDLVRYAKSGTPVTIQK